MEIIQGCEATAISRYNRISPSKVRRIADQIRSRSVKESIMILEFMPYRSCKFILTLLISAINNGKMQYGPGKEWFVKEIYVNEGPSLKRFRPRAQGRGFPIKKRMCHITSQN
uniref:Large ribosomal subunit protein uL22c n=1 Tax=Trachelomonas volvocina TaxID=103340 RepID=A0A0G3VR28_9EUGL|nr:ribosomal protein L22 [Trachelomonas volvocina]AKL82435.1 ribosomal protein L22 [Trachelomonas volvocina]